MSGRIVELIKGKKYRIIVEAGRDPATGKRKRISRTVFGRKPEAEMTMANLLRQLEHGTYIEPSKETVSEFLDHWLKAYAANKAPSTYVAYKRIVNSHIKPHLGHIPLLKLQPMHIQEYYTNRRLEGRRDGKGGLSANSVIRHHAVLRQALGHAVNWQKLHRNPADLVKPPSPEVAEIFPLEPDQLDELLRKAAGTRDEYLYIVAAYSGMREGELLALEWHNVDFGKKPCCRVRQTVGYIPKTGFVFRPTAKNKKARREVPQFDIAVKALKAQKQTIAQEKLLAGQSYDNSRNLVFPRLNGGPMDPTEMSRRFKQVAVGAGFPRIRFHDLRHTHATMLLKMGIHPKIVQERLGHQTIGITMDTYTHAIEGMQWAVVDQVNNYLADPNGTQMAHGDENGRS